MSNVTSMAERFALKFGRPATVAARAPGRVNLIGEHTDYTDGLVLPFAIEPCVLVAASHSHRGRHGLTVYSEALDETFECSLDGPGRAKTGRWMDYIRGVLAELRVEGINSQSTNLWIGGDLPLGKGMASSAALCVAITQALLHLWGSEMASLESARLAQRVERDHVGTPCGLMDPYAILFGRRDHALLIDCHAQEHQYVSLELPGFQWVLVDTGISHQLASGDYGRRVEECEAVTSALAALAPKGPSIRDLTPTALDAYLPRIHSTLGRRLRHIVTENDRVRQAVAALGDRDARRLGACLDASHQSLRDDFEVSTPRIEELRDVVSAGPGVVGVRLIGGGFGGMLLALVCDQSLADFRRTLTEFPGRPNLPNTGIHVIRSADAASTWRM